MHRRSFASTQGSSLIEFAVTLPVLAMMIFAIAQFGIAYNRYIVLTDAVRVGARALALTRGIANPCQTAGAKVPSAATSLNASNITLTATVNGSAYTASAGSIPQCSGQGTTMSAGADAVMRATYPCSIVIYGLNIVPSCTLTSQTTVRVE